MCVHLIDYFPVGSLISHPCANLSYVREMSTDTNIQPVDASVSPWPTPYIVLFVVVFVYSSHEHMIDLHKDVK